MADRRLSSPIAIPALWRDVVSARLRAAHRLFLGPATPASDTALPRRRFRLRKRYLAGAGLLIVGAVSAAFLLAVGLTGRAPAWWRSIDPSNPATLRTGTDLEAALVEEFSRVRPAAADLSPSQPGPWRSEDWAFSIPASDANAWLNARLPKWLANRATPVTLPPELVQLQVEFDQGLVHVGALVRHGDASRILSATLVPRLAADGSLWFTATWLQAGRLPVPAGWILQRAADPKRDYLPERLRRLPETVAMLRAFAGEIPIIHTPVVSLGDGRRVRLLSLAARDGRLEVHCRTEKK